MQPNRTNTKRFPASSEPLCAEASLVFAAKTGDKEAFTQLCEHSSKRVLFTILRITKNLEDAEDAFQDATLRAFRRLDSFDGRSSFSTWFTRIGINAALMILRKRKRHIAVSLEELNTNEIGEPMMELPDTSPNPEELYVTREQKLRLRGAINGLPASHRSIVEMHFLRGHSVRDIASANHISISATKSRLSRSRPRLLALLQRA
jgi:RNA polymerase sigma-70 factor (ECF subfamily)